MINRFRVLCSAFFFSEVILASAGTVAMVPNSYEGKGYVSVLSSQELDDAPIWEPSDNHPPLAIKAAISISEKMILEFVSQNEFASEWRLLSVHLSFRTTKKDAAQKCYYVVNWRGKTRGFSSDGDLRHEEFDSFGIIVLMNGKAIKPVESPVQNKPEETKDKLDAKNED